MTETTPDPQVTEGQETENQPAFGWTPYAEVMNGRFAMLGFVALLIQQLITRQDFFTWLGF